ncbi:hypothetical protein BKA65DRAFT_501274 [Rhexocercosporidium sp. MPI-PUGE-AT-0058]|nr:hypothetical protein BKA65DRAFT_501274 [Rhexocercosporidium sp. MPI-PUGE-AT-0058]
MPPSTTHKDAAALIDIWRVSDDWTDVDSKEEKKRRQNRINQRAYRRRNQTTENASKQRPFRVERFRITDLPVSAIAQKDRLGEAINLESAQPPNIEEDQIEQHAVPASEASIKCSEHMRQFEAEALQVLADSQKDLVALPELDTTSGEGPNYNSTDINLLLKAASQEKSSFGVIDPSGSKTAAISSATSALEAWFQDSNRSLAPQVTLGTGHFHSRDPDGQALFRISFEQLVSPHSPENTILNSKTPPLNPNGFPLSSDHLLRLIHFNVFRGLITNKALLSGRTFQTKVNLDFILPASRNLCDGLALIRSKPGQALPTALYPTYVQSSIAHSSWINMFPFPAIRDNLIKAEKDFDHEDLCSDLFGEMFFSRTLEPISKEVRVAEDEFEDDVTANRKGLIVWGEPWDMNSWEVTPGFVKKWAWLLKNNYDWIEPTNRWRAKRDEKPLSYPFSQPLDLGELEAL